MVVTPIKRKSPKFDSEIEVFAGIDKNGNIYIEVCEIIGLMHIPAPFIGVRVNGRSCRRAVVYVGDVDRAIQTADKIKRAVLASKPRSIDEAFQIISRVLRSNV